MFNSLKIRTIAIFLLINILLFGLLVRFSYRLMRNLYLEQFHEQVAIALSVIDRDTDRHLLNYISPNMPSMAQTYLTAALQRLDSLLKVENIFIFNRNGQVLSAIQKSDALTGLLINRQSISRLKSGQRLISEPFKADDGQWYLWAFKRLDGSYFVGLRENAQRLAQINRLSDKFLILGLMGILLSFLSALFIARSVHAPLKEITDFSKQIGQGNFSARAPGFRLKELLPLTNALSQMRDALAQRDREKEQMLAQIAHELRNPLGGIELLTGLIRDDLPADHKDQPYLKNILNEVHHLKEQINEFLNYSRPRPAEKTPVFLPALMEELQEHFAPKLKAKPVKLITEFKRDTILFDRDHLKHILTNLILNSYQAIDNAEGKIIIRSLDNCLEIEDNGCGIKQDERENIFQPFFTGKDDGIGLGLTICRNLCRLNGADIQVFEAPQGGALFRIELNNGDVHP